jgi:hypothetical protein
MFFGDLESLDGPVIKIAVRTGQSLYLPPSWLQFVYAPTDTVAFGVNFICGAKLDAVSAAYEFEVNPIKYSHNPHNKNMLFSFESC